MVKRRTPKASTQGAATQTPTPEQIEAFASGAEGGSQNKQQQAPEPDQDAIRDYKAMRVPFNQHEYEQLALGAKLSGRTKLNFLRYAMLTLSKELQKKEAQD